MGGTTGYPRFVCWLRAAVAIFQGRHYLGGGFPYGWLYQLVCILFSNTGRNDMRNPTHGQGRGLLSTEGNSRESLGARAFDFRPWSAVELKNFLCVLTVRGAK